MFEYTFTKEVEILTPFKCNFSDIKKEITQTPDFIRNHSTYPNGVILDMYQYFDKVVIKSNKKLIDNNDGTVTVVL